MESSGQGRPLAVLAFLATTGTRPLPLDTNSNSASSRFLPFYAKLFAIHFPEFFEEHIMLFRRVFVSSCFCQDLEVLIMASSSGLNNTGDDDQDKDFRATKGKEEVFKDMSEDNGEEVEEDQRQYPYATIAKIGVSKNPSVF